MKKDDLVGNAARLAEVVGGHDDLAAARGDLADDPFDLERGAGVEAGQIVAYLEAREVLKGVAAPQAGVLGAPIAADGAVVGFGDALFAFDKR